MIMFEQEEGKIRLSVWLVNTELLLGKLRQEDCQIQDNLTKIKRCVEHTSKPERQRQVDLRIQGQSGLPTEQVPGQPGLYRETLS